jgi:hypothetical protein
MDVRQARRTFWAQIVLVSAFVLLLYLYLANRASPDFSLWELIKGVVKLFLLMWDRIPEGVMVFFRDIGLFVTAYLLWIIFFAQFTLPIRNFGQRILASIYLFWYSLGQHAPAIKIDNGRIPDRYPRDRPQRRGVIVLDTASAALLRTRTQFTRSVGPGLVFTAKGEYLAGSVDLHRQVSHNPALGPLKDEEDPFAPRDEAKESQEAHEQRQKRRFETSGETRDAVQVVPNISTVSRLDPNIQPSSENIYSNGPGVRGLRGWLRQYMQSDALTRFGYNPESVRLAITGEAVDPMVKLPFAEKRHIPWYELPAYLAVDLWREYLRRFTFEELFTELEAYGGQTAYQVIHEKVFERLTRPYVLEVDQVGKPTGRLVDSREFSMLQDRGIQVFSVYIRNLRFEKKIDQQLEDKWVSFWQLRAEAERDFINRKRSYSIHEGEKDSQREFAYQATRRFDSNLVNSPRPSTPAETSIQMRLALERMLRGTLGQCLQDTQLHQRLSGEESQLIAIIEWLRRL